MAVAVDPGPSPRLGTPQRLFRWSPSWTLDAGAYAVAGDGRFLMVRNLASESDDNALRMVESWASELAAAH
jgi:hypothetical protein